MKKLLIAVLAVLCVAPAAMAKDWGAAVKIGAGENDPKGMKDEFNSPELSLYSRELDKSAGYLSFEVLHEWALNDEANKLGLKIGWETYGVNKLDNKTIGGNIKENTDAFPFTVYYRRDNGVGKFSWFAGAGFTIIHTKLESEGAYWDKRSASKNRVFPHIAAGAEYRFTQVFALGLDARYNISAKVKKHGEVFSDRSGFGAALAARFYF